jgi:hypothetical protein
MSFSATGNLLTGSIQRPDTVTCRFSDKTARRNISSTYSTNCTLNRLGYKPIVSTITGLGRALLGLVHTIVHLVCAIFSKNKAHHIQEAKLGAKNIARGLIEAIPIIGNITMFVVDYLRMGKFEKMVAEQVNKNRASYDNQAVLFVYGKEFARRPIAEFNAEYENLSSSKKPTEDDLVQIICRQNR